MKKITNLFLILAVALGSSMCHHEDVVRDTTAPTTTLTLPQKSSYVHHTVSLNAAAVDNVKVTKMELYIDGVMVTDATDPFLNFSWNTKTILDGKHTLRVVAYDSENNTGEAVVIVNVMNVLLTVAIDPGFEPDNYYEFIFLSDRNGNTLISKKLENNEVITFETPPNFNDSIFAINSFYRSVSPTFEFQYILAGQVNTLPGYKINRTVTTTGGDYSVVGTATASFSNIVGTVTYSGSAVQSQSQPNSSDASISLLAASSDLLIVIHTSDDRYLYKYYDKIEIGNNLKLSLSDLVEMKESILNFDLFDDIHISVYVTRNNRPYDICAGFYQGVISQNIPYFDNDFFDSYNVNVAEYKDAVEYGHRFYNVKTIPTKLIDISSELLSYEKSGNVIHFTAIDQHDVQTVSASAFVANSDYSFMSTFIAPVTLIDSGQLVIPAIPEILVSQYNVPSSNKFNFDRWTLEQQVPMDQAGQSYETIYKIQNLSSSGGRKSTSNHMRIGMPPGTRHLIGDDVRNFMLESMHNLDAKSL